MKTRTLITLAALVLATTLVGCSKSEPPQATPPAPVSSTASVTQPLQPSCSSDDVNCAAATGHATRREPQTDANVIELGLPELGSVCRTNWPQPHSWDCGYDEYDPPYFADWRCTTVTRGHSIIGDDGKATKKDIRVCFRSSPPAEVAAEIVKTFSSRHFITTRATAWITTHINGSEQSGFTPGEGWREAK